MTMLTQQEPATAGQEEQVTCVAVDAVRKAVADYFAQKKPTKVGAQAIHANGNVIVATLRDKIFTVYDEVAITDKYQDEEVRSNYTYPKEYRGAKPIKEQVYMLAKALDLSTDLTIEWIEKVMSNRSLHVCAEGRYAIPSVDAIARRHFPEVTDQAEKYCRAVEMILEKLGKSRSFYNYREGEITPRQLRQHARTLHALDMIAEQQKGDILVIPAQFGLRHRGRSVRRAPECFIGAERLPENLIPGDEFGFGALAVGSMALTHPERYVRWEQLHTDCAGDEFAPDAGGDFSRSPFFFFDGGGLRFGASVVSDAYGRYGSVSGFLPQ